MRLLLIIFATIRFPQTRAFVGHPSFPPTIKMNRISLQQRLVTRYPGSRVINDIGTRRASFPRESPHQMSLNANQLVATIVPSMGVLTSTILYFSPLTAVRAAVRHSSLGSMNPLPLVIMSLSSLCWLLYGLFIQDFYLSLANIPGLVASIWYVVAILPLLKGETLRSTQSLVVTLSAATGVIWTWLIFAKKSAAEVSSVLGLVASFLYIALCGSPLSTIKVVLSTKNSISILTSLTLAQVTDTALWSAYGVSISDKFLWGPNLAGLGFALIQLLLKMIYPSKRPEITCG